MNSIEDIFDRLFDGTKEQISTLLDAGVSYTYSVKYNSFTVSSGEEEMRAHKLFDRPKCVDYFGDEYGN